MMEDRGIEGYRGRLNRNCVTIAEALKPAGYRNYAVGKWHVTPGQTAKALADTGNWPLQQNPSFPFSDPRPGPLAAAALPPPPGKAIFLQLAERRVSKNPWQCGPERYTHLIGISP